MFNLPKWLVPLTIVLTVVALVPAALITRARATKQTEPRINLIPDMDYQPKFLPQTENGLFADGRAMRPPIEGTVARGELHDDEHFWEGRQNGEWATTFPMPVTEQLLQRGRERFEIFCAPCHGLGGGGNGLVALRADRLQELGKAAWTPPLSIHDDTIRERSVGHLFNTITYGIRSMPAYGPQVPAEDRWAIVSYVRALQRSTNATIDDVPADVRPTLK